MTVLGIDAGLNGALALYDEHLQQMIHIWDMPSFMMVVGKKQRKRIDAVALLNVVDTCKSMGCKMALIEAVGGRPKQSGGFVFGYSVGLVYMACIAVRLPIETVPPQVWKKVMRVPGKKDTSDVSTAIVGRADELMPEHRHMWRGPQGGLKVDRAEAAVIAKYCADYMLHNMTPEKWKLLQSETEMVYKNADTGA